MVRRTIFLFLACFMKLATPMGVAGTFEQDVAPLLTNYCVDCHGEDEANAEIDFSSIGEDESRYELWESVVGLVNDGIMPPSDELQPNEDEKRRLNNWYDQLIDGVEPHPGYFRPRRLAAHEYRNTLHSIFGFDLDVAIVEAEQTVSEKSLVMKLLPLDPPGPSGFKNDTSGNPLSVVIWDQYSYLIDNALDRLFSTRYRESLESHVGRMEGDYLSTSQATALVRSIAKLAYRRPVPASYLKPSLESLEGKEESALHLAVRDELKTILMSPKFMYRGLLLDVPTDQQYPDQQYPVDDFELAERLSYFLWADMPDEELMNLAETSQLGQENVLQSQIDRMLASPKSSRLGETLGVEWFSLNEIDHVSDNPPIVDALKRQPIDFVNYLFTQDRPLLEIIDSDVTFVNAHSAKYYPGDRRQLAKYQKKRGIEVESLRNQMIKLTETKERGGLLTMPGVLAMNRGPILRGTWMLERILGEHLPDPPANVGQVPNNKRGENLTFRERFEQHRESVACAACHDKIDPLGFALEAYGSSGELLSPNSGKLKLKRAKKKETELQVASDQDSPAIDTSGQLPTGEAFGDFQELKKILVTAQRERVIRNIVRRTMAYALCRKLTIHDRPAVEAIVDKLDSENGTFGDLIHEIAASLPFRETVVRSGEKVGMR